MTDMPSAAVLTLICGDGMSGLNSGRLGTLFGFFCAGTPELVETSPVELSHAVVLDHGSPMAAGSAKCSSLRMRLTVARPMLKLFAICVSD